MTSKSNTEPACVAADDSTTEEKRIAVPLGKARGGYLCLAAKSLFMGIYVLRVSLR